VGQFGGQTVASCRHFSGVMPPALGVMTSKTTRVGPTGVKAGITSWCTKWLSIVPLYDGTQTASIIPLLVNPKLRPCCPIVSEPDGNEAALNLLLTIFLDLLRALDALDDSLRDFLGLTFGTVAVGREKREKRERRETRETRETREEDKRRGQEKIREEN